jgi:amidohydrolase
MTANSLLARMEPYREAMLALRHDIHRHPETAYEEHRTAAVLMAELDRLGIEYTSGIAGTGIVATLTGTGGKGRTIGLRADMDALNIQEVAGRPHGSTISGKMHACGHDGHMAMLMGAASYLADNRDFSGSVRFIFQPAEEGYAGGRRMIEEGLFERFPVDAMYGMHNMPGLETGRFRTRAGPFLAASDGWTVTFRGTGGHGGAGVHDGTDPTLALAQFLVSLQTIVSRSVSPINAAVVSVGHLAGGSPQSPNIIPSEVTVSGTARSYKPEVRDTIERRLAEIAQAQALSFNCTAEVDYRRLYPPLVTTRDETAIAARAAAEIAGSLGVEANTDPLTISEDFAFMLQERPGGFVLIGNGLAEEGYTALHTATYEFNDDILPIGAGYWVELVSAELVRNP